MTDIITKPGNYCRADGVKVRIEYQDEEGEWRSTAGSYWTDGLPCCNGAALISTWSARPDAFRKPKPAYRKDGSPRWPVGTRAVLVAWEDGAKHNNGKIIIMRDDFPCWAGSGMPVTGERGHRPLFRKIKDAAPKAEPRELVPHGGYDAGWAPPRHHGDTHRLSLTIIGDQVTGTLEAL